MVQFQEEFYEREDTRKKKKPVRHTDKFTYELWGWRSGKPHRFIKVGYQKNEEVVYARYLYEQTYGVKLKPSDMIIHLDGDSLNDDLDNLMLVDVKDHLNIIGAPGIKYTEDKDINKAIVLATKLQRVAKEKSE